MCRQSESSVETLSIDSCPSQWVLAASRQPAYVGCNIHINQPEYVSETSDPCPALFKPQVTRAHVRRNSQHTPLNRPQAIKSINHQEIYNPARACGSPVAQHLCHLCSSPAAAAAGQRHQLGIGAACALPFKLGPWATRDQKRLPAAETSPVRRVHCTRWARRW